MEIMEQERILEELDKCANGWDGFVYWSSHYAYTWNEETKQKQIFATFDDNPNYKDYIYNLIFTIHTKRLALRSIEHPDILIVKSRQLYFTWSITTYLTWCMLFEDNFSALITSDKEPKIDGQPRNNANTNLGKVSYIVHNLPEWLQPKDFIESHLKRGVECIGSIITGDSGTDPGRGQAYSIHLADEFASQEFTHSKLAACREAIKGTNILLSTPKGTNNAFYDVYIQARDNPTESSYDIITSHWKDRIAPDKQDEFWKQAVRKYNGDMAMLNQELNHSFEGSLIKGRAFNQFMFAKHTVSILPTNFSHGRIVCGVDFGYSHPTVFVFLAEMSNGVWHIFDLYEASELHPRVHTTNIISLLNRWGLTTDNCTFYGDPSGESKPREGTGESSFELFRNAGIKMIPANNRVMEGIQKVNDLFYQDKLYVSSYLPTMIDALNQAKFPVNRNGAVIGEKYEETEYTDRLDALRYAVMQAYKPRQSADHLKGQLKGLGMGNVSSKRL